MIAYLAGLVAVQKPVDLTFRPALDAKAVYTLKRTYLDAELEETTVLEDKLELKVIQRDSRGPITVEWAWTPTGETLDGQTVPLPKDLKPWRVKEVRRANGSLLSRDENPDDPVTHFRLARLLAPVLPPEPVLPGQDWTAERAYEPGSEIPGWRSTSRLLGITDAGGRSFARVKGSFAEDGAASPMEGTFSAEIWISSGLLKALELKAKGARIPGGEGRPQTLKLELASLP